jgi:hypothetical protein
MMEHPRPDTPGTGNFARHGPMRPGFSRIAVMAPDDAPGLHALRARLGAWPGLNAEHHAVAFRMPDSAALPEIFERVLERHQKQPYDAILLIDGREDALGIAESTRMIPEQLRRMPMPAWSAIGEDDANTEIGDAAAKTFRSPQALLEALQQNQSSDSDSDSDSKSPAAAVPVEPPAAAMRIQPAAAALVEVMPAQLRLLPAPRTRAHPLVLCASVAVIMASVTAMAAMLGVLPDLGRQAKAPTALQPAAAKDGATTILPAADIAPAPPSMPVLPAAAKPAAAAANAPAPKPSAITPVAAPLPAGIATPAPEAPPSPASPAPSAPQEAAPGGDEQGPASETPPKPSKLAPAGPAPPQATATAANAPRAHSPRRASKRKHSALAFAQQRRYQAPGSEEVPSFNFVGSKTRAQVMAELVESRRRGNAYPEPELAGASASGTRYKR